MIKPERIVVLYGGVGPEREVSLVSGKALADALARKFRVDLVDVKSEALPDGIDPERSIVFPALHGAFGEDGRLQALLEEAGIDYAGSDSTASRLCMDKGATKEKARELGVLVPDGILFDGTDCPKADDVIAQLGQSLVIKPADQGSSVGLHFAEHRSALGVVLSKISQGRWMIEQRIRGRELTVGLFRAAAMGIVEVKSASGVYDYEAKYASGTTKYEYPALLDAELETRIKVEAERLFEAFGCRDFARVDFLLEEGRPYFLEINTLPGLTATSLLPKSASCVGFDFEQLAVELLGPALERFEARQSKDSAS